MQKKKLHDVNLVILHTINKNKKTKVVLWASHPNIIAFSKPNNGKYENHLLI